jgi:transposase
VGFLRAVSGADDRRGSATSVSIAGDLQCPALSDSGGRSLAHDAARFAALAYVYQPAQRWIKAGCFEAMAHDLRAILRMALERKADPTAAILDSRTVQSTPESGARAGFDGHKKRKRSKVHIAVDTLGHLLALAVTPANEQDRAQVGQLAQAVQALVEEPVQLAFVDQGYTGEKPAAAAAQEGIQLELVNHTEAKHGFVLLLRRWVVERARLLGRRDFDDWPATTNGCHPPSLDTTGWRL